MVNNPNESPLFNQATIVISVFLTILGLVGVVFRPENLSFIFLGIALCIFIVFLYQKFDQINQNTNKIMGLEKELNAERRFGEVEKELAEQKGKLSMVVKRK